MRLKYVMAPLVLALLSSCGGGGSSGSAQTDVARTNGLVAQEAKRPGSAQVRVRLSEVSRGFSFPWGMAFLPDGRLLVTERAGRLQVVDSNGRKMEIFGVPPMPYLEQAGLLDVALDPRFADNGFVYLTFAERDDTDASLTGTSVARAFLDLSSRQLVGWVVIYRQWPKVASERHYGARLAFGHDGYLFLTMGERFLAEEAPKAQDLGLGHGKVVRITTDGLAAPQNPFMATSGAQPEIWTLGHRNPQGAAVHPLTGDLWISEHGAQGGDEINRLLSGGNYGWPLVSRSQQYGTEDPIGVSSQAGMVDPVWVWETIDGSPWTAGPKSSTAPAGMAFYPASGRVSQWRGNLFVTALVGRALWRLTLNGNTVVGQERMLADLNERLRDVEVAPDGALFLITDSGRLLRYGP
jgi:glucose/arabinose dehydrogenase